MRRGVGAAVIKGGREGVELVEAASGGDMAGGEAVRVAIAVVRDVGRRRWRTKKESSEEEKKVFESFSAGSASAGVPVSCRAGA